MLCSTSELRRKPRSMSCHGKKAAYRSPRGNSHNWDYYSYYPTVNTMRVSKSGDVLFLSQPRYQDRSWILPDSVDYDDSLGYPHIRQRAGVRVVNEVDRRRSHAVRAKFRRWLKYVSANPTLPYDLMAKLNGVDLDLDNFLEYLVALCLQNCEIKIEDWSIEDFFALLLRYVTKYLGRGYNYMNYNATVGPKVYLDPPPYNPVSTLLNESWGPIRPPYSPAGCNPYADPTLYHAKPFVKEEFVPVHPQTLRVGGPSTPRGGSYPQVPVEYSCLTPAQTRKYHAQSTACSGEIAEQQAFYDSWSRYTRDPLGMYRNKEWHPYYEPKKYNRRRPRWNYSPECWSDYEDDECYY